MTTLKPWRFTFNGWGIAALVIFGGDFWLSAYSFRLQDSGQAPLFSTVTNYEQAVVANVTAGVCAFIAQRRGHWSWRFLILLCGWGALVNFMGEL
jgi:hypothetical protein